MLAVWAVKLENIQQRSDGSSAGMAVWAGIDALVDVALVVYQIAERCGTDGDFYCDVVVLTCYLSVELHCLRGW